MTCELLLLSLLLLLLLLLLLRGLFLLSRVSVSQFPLTVALSLGCASELLCVFRNAVSHAAGSV